MAPPNPKRPPRPPRPPGTQAPKDSDVELPFDDDEVDPLRADDPRPQRVPQFPAGSRRSKRQGGERGSHDRELSPRFDWGHEYSDPGFTPAFLYVERGPGAGQLVPVKQGPLVMGRSSSADLRLQHPSISRRHAQLVRRGDRFLLKDLSSQNGTFLNRNRVTSEVEVMTGDEISMGNALLRLRGPGSTPAVGAPIATATVKTGRRRKGVGTLGVALIAAAVGSAVAALLTLVAVNLGDEEAVPPAPAAGSDSTTPPVQAAPGETGSAGEGTGSQPETRAPAEDARGGPAAAVAVGATDDARGGPAEGATGDARGGPAAATEATNDARGGPAAAAAGATDELATADGEVSRSAAPTGEQDGEGASAAASENSRENRPRRVTGPSAMAVARGAVDSSARRQERSTVALPSARDVAAGGARLERSEASTPTARDVAAGSTKARGGKDAVTEADVLRRYESGDVVGAREQARAAKLTALHAQLARFESAEAESRKAQSKGDLPRAIAQLTTAVSVDHALAQGWSKHGDSLRKRLSQLHVKQGLEHARAGETSEARAAFEQALKYDAGNREARERLSSAAAPAP